MTASKQLLLSVVVPVFNERLVLPEFHGNLLATLEGITGYDFEIIYCDDGSTDDTAQIVENFRAQHKNVKLLALSRNFGKEVAISAGLAEASGAAVLSLDADGQHPVELIPSFIKHWEAGDKVVIGLRTANQREGMVKRYGSKLFYSLFSRLTGLKLVSGATDFRLIDRTVQREFLRMTERNRVTRGLLDWLGYNPRYISFKANPRLAGEAGYSYKKLIKLAIDSMVSLSISPLYITAYIGAFVLPTSALLGIGMLVNALLSDPLGLHATGGAYVLVLVLFLVGILLVSQGIIGLYLSHIHTETQNRPLYIIDEHRSRGIREA